MIQVKIIGAGSIGNHLAHACRELDWAVTLCDIDAQALVRTREDIYPGRYGAWDAAIRLAAPEAVRDESFDIVIIGTPPDTHIALALAQIESAPPRLLLIEKPLCTPDLSGCPALEARAEQAGTRLLVAYNHRLTRHTQIAREWLGEGLLGQITTLRARFREHWGGIFKAHPWLAGPADTYLGFTERGGGALCEHSHAINIWQYFAEMAGLGRIARVAAMVDEVQVDGAAYDRIAQLSVETERGVIGSIVQDVVTRPAQKWLRLEGEEGYLEWEVNADADHDRVALVRHHGERREERVAKTRPDDFRGEVAHLRELLERPGQESPLDWSTGMDTMHVIVAALEASRRGRHVDVNYDSGTLAGHAGG